MSIIRVLSVDDHPVVREGLRWMLGSDGIDVAAEAGDLETAVGLIGKDHFDIVLLDIDLAGRSSLNGLDELRRRFPNTPVVMLTMSDDPDDVEAAVRAGATGYLLKDAPRDEFVRAIRAAAGDKAYIQADVMSPLLQRFARSVGTRGGVATLSKRERDVISLAADGLANKQIAAHLGISPATVKEYLQHVYDKLGAADRAQAVAVALRSRLID